MSRKYQLDPSITETVITHSVTIRGDLEVENDLFIDGVLKGNVVCVGNVTIGTNARIIGNVTGGNITLGGDVKGNIKAEERLVINSSARINGDLTTQQLSITEGAIILGKINMSESNFKNTQSKFDESHES